MYMVWAISPIGNLHVIFRIEAINFPIFFRLVRYTNAHINTHRTAEADPPGHQYLIPQGLGRGFSGGLLWNILNK
jgi:hypothetical protein